jgi:hypothetical protein
MKSLRFFAVVFIVGFAAYTCVFSTTVCVPTSLWPFNRIGLTGEPITTEIEKRLSWLRGLNGEYLEDGSRNAPLELQAGYFKQG